MDEWRATCTAEDNCPAVVSLHMHTEGWFRPSTLAEARERYEAMGGAAQTVVREVARAMEFDREEYKARVTSDVIETARDALFASLLEVHVGTQEEFADWQAAHNVEVHKSGSDTVDNVVWHGPPFSDQAAAATFQAEEQAAVETLRRQAFGRIYRNRL